MKESRFNETITRLLNEKLKRFFNKDIKLNAVVCVEIYQTIFECLVEVFETSKSGLTNEAMNLLAQLYYDSILVNGQHELDPRIFSQRAKLENIQTKELALLALMLNGTELAFPILAEIKKRS